MRDPQVTMIVSILEWSIMSNDLDDLGLLPTLGNLQMFTSGQIFSGTYVETLGGLPQIDHKLND